MQSWCFAILRTNFSSLHELQTGRLLLTLYFIRTRLQWYHTFKQQGHLASIKEDFIQRVVSVPVFPLVSANDACGTHFLTLTPSAPYYSVTLSIFACISTSLSSSSLALWHLLCLFGYPVLFVYCFQMADADFIWAAFKFPERFFTALAQALILFPLAGLYDGPFIRSNWK